MMQEQMVQAFEELLDYHDPVVVRRWLNEESGLSDRRFEDLPPRVQKWIGRALRVRAESPVTAWEVFRHLQVDVAATYPERWRDSVPGHGYNGGGMPASRFLWRDIPSVMEMLKEKFEGEIFDPTAN